MRITLLLLIAFVLAGCGGSDGGPPVDREVATKLARQAGAIATARDPCRARTHARTLQRQTIAAINAGRIPAEYLEPLQSRVNAIVATLELRCLPTPSTSAETAPAVVFAPADEERKGDKDRGKGKDRDKKKGKDNGKGERKGGDDEEDDD